MPRYEFLCEKCRTPFEFTMTISEHEEGQAERPQVQGHEGRTAARRLHGAYGEEALKVGG
jgi:hypothetical protein